MYAKTDITNGITNKYKMARYTMIPLGRQCRLCWDNSTPDFPVPLKSKFMIDSNDQWYKTESILEMSMSI